MILAKTAHTTPDYDVVIIGAGVTGFAAAMYSGRLGLKTLVIGEKPGGTITMTDEIANYPGFKMITGVELAERIQEHAKEYKISFENNIATRVTQCSKGCLKVYTLDRMFHTHTIIFATGTEWKKLGVLGEEEFTNKGVHYCALCDGPFYKRKTVAVIGGSDSAAKDALLLTRYARRVYLICKGEKIRPEPINYKRVIKNKKIRIINKTKVVKIIGRKKVESIMLDKRYKGSKELKLDAVFIDVGHTPLSGLAKSLGVKLNKSKEIIIDRESQTNVPGIFAAGDVADTKFKQAITGAGEGVIAAYSAYHYINENEFICMCNDDDM